MDHGADTCWAVLESPLGCTCPVEIKLFCWIEMSLFLCIRSYKEKSCQQLRPTCLCLSQTCKGTQTVSSCSAQQESVPVILQVLSGTGKNLQCSVPRAGAVLAVGSCPDTPWCWLSSCHICHCQWLHSQGDSCSVAAPAQPQLWVLLP